MPQKILKILLTFTVAMWVLLSVRVSDAKSAVKKTVVPIYERHCTFTPPKGFSVMLARAGSRYNIDSRILAVTVYRESGCRKDALGGVGEIGLMQINPSVWMKDLTRDLGIKKSDLWDPSINIMAGAYVMNTIRSESKNTRDIFRRYNGSGPLAERYAAKQVFTYYRLWNRFPSSINQTRM